MPIERIGSALGADGEGKGVLPIESRRSIGQRGVKLIEVIRGADLGPQIKSDRPLR